jgi:hypothetical protein
MGWPRWSVAQGGAKSQLLPLRRHVKARTALLRSRPELFGVGGWNCWRFAGLAKWCGRGNALRQITTACWLKGRGPSSLGLASLARPRPGTEAANRELQPLRNHCKSFTHRGLGQRTQAQRGAAKDPPWPRTAANETLSARKYIENILAAKKFIGSFRAPFARIGLGQQSRGTDN